MAKWKDENYLNRLWESEENESYLSTLRKLINGEAVASIQYKIASESLIGDKNFDYLASHFAQHSEEEWDHYSMLVNALLERDSSPDLTFDAFSDKALPETEELESSDTEYLRKFFIHAEDEAIKAYQEFYDTIEDKDKDLADIINSIISDEREHKLDFTRVE